MIPVGYTLRVEKKLANVITKAGTLLVGAEALSFLIIWIFFPEYKEFSAVTMKANTSLAFLLISISIWLLRRGPDKTGNFFAWTVLFIATLTNLEYIFDINLGIDEIIVSDFPNTESVMFLGRMSPIASLCLTFVSAALLTLDTKPLRHWHWPTFFLFPVWLISFLAIVGYAYGVTSFYKLGPFIRISLPTALSLNLISFIILSSRPSLGPLSILYSPGFGGMTARRVLPSLSVLPVFLGWLRIQAQHLGYIDLYSGVAVLVVVLTVLFCFIVGFHAVKLDSLDAERERSRIDLEKTARRFAAIFNHAPTAFALFRESDGAFVDVNDAWIEHFGYSKAEVLGKTTRDFKWYVDENERQRLYEVYRRDGFVRNFETKVYNGVGQVLIVSNSVHKVEIEGEKFVLGALEDVTELRKLADSLAAAVQVRDEFMSIASHELKTPITSLKLQLQMLQRAVKVEQNVVPNAERLAKTLSVTNRQIQRLEGLVEELLDVSRVRTGKLSLHFEKFNLSSLVSEVVDRLASQLSEAKIEVNYEVEPEVAGSWDRSRIDQVIVNLLNNAIKYAAGEPILLKVKNAGDRALLAVADGGPGIPSEKQQLIFERFERATQNKSIPGLGIGLFLVKQIVEEHQGNISVKSDLGKGAVFEVVLPKHEVMA